MTISTCQFSFIYWIKLSRDENVEDLKVVNMEQIKASTDNKLVFLLTWLEDLDCLRLNRWWLCMKVGYIVMMDPSTGTSMRPLRMSGAGVVGVYYPLIDEKLVKLLHG